MGVERSQRQYKGRSPKAPALQNALYSCSRRKRGTSISLALWAASKLFSSTPLKNSTQQASDSLLPTARCNKNKRYRGGVMRGYLEGWFRAYRGGAMQDLGYELPGILVPRSWMNKPTLSWRRSCVRAHKREAR